MEGYQSSTYGDRFADVYDDWYGDITDAERCTEHLIGLVEHVGGGPLLELGIGSGRLALPLVARGVEVHGIDASPGMLALLETKPGGRSIHATLGDMADLALVDPPPFAVVLVAFNTLFNLGTAAAQQQCLNRVAALLAPSGRLVIEAFVPRDDIDAASQAVTPRQVTVDEVVLTVSQVDPDSQTITGQHIHVRESGIRLRPWHLRYAGPDELDAMAEQAGLTLDTRCGGWRGEQFTSASGVHVSTYRRGNVRSVPDQLSSIPR